MNLTPEASRLASEHDARALARGPETARQASRSAGKPHTLIVVGALALLSLGLLGAWCVRELDFAYTQVIQDSARRFSTLQDLGENLALLDVRLAVDLVSPRAPKADAFLGELAQTQTQTQTLLRELEPFVNEPFFLPGVAELRAREKALGEACQRLTTILVRGDPLAANAYRLEQVLPLVDQTRAAARQLNRLITDHMLQNSNEATDKADRLTKLVAGLGALPLVIGATLLLFVVTILCLLAWQLRQDPNAP